MEDATLTPRVTRTTSLTSVVTGDIDSGDSVQHGETVRVDSLTSESILTEWTNEKHSLYLKSMETSFVNQLYNSLNLLGCHSQKEYSPDAKSSRKMYANTRVSSGQFNILRGGCWEKINFERDEPQLDPADGFRILLANPWIRHFKSACRHQVITSPNFLKKVAFEGQAIHLDRKMALTSTLAPNSKQFHMRDSHLCCHDSAGSNTEVSDQNFVDEDIKGDKAIHTCSAKRVKTSVVASSSNDQVVPFKSS